VMPKSTKNSPPTKRVQAAFLATLGDRLFSQPVPDELVANHASYIRDASAKTMAHFHAFLSSRSLIFTWLHSALLGLATILRDAFQSNYYSNANLTGDTRPCDVLVISHLTNTSQLAAQNDPYFADLAQQLQALDGLKTTTFRVNQARTPLRGVELGTGQLLESGRFGFLEGCQTWIANACQSLALLRRSCWEDDPDFKRFLRFLSCTQMDHRTMAARRIVKRVGHVVSLVQPKIVVLTYEGYSWERALAQQLRRLNPAIQILGYQHAVICGGARAINKKFAGGLSPDHILAAGDAITARLVAESDYELSDFTIIGSAKATHVNESPQGNALVAVPEGTVSETVVLAECLSAVAQQMPDMPCILRLHPALPWGRIKAKIRDWNAKSSNLSISNISLDDDIGRAGWVLYRGSSVAITALLANRQPLFFDCDDSADTGDIIPDEIRWRCICKTPGEVVATILADGGESGRDDEESKIGRQFAQRYYRPLNHDLFNSTVKSYLLSDEENF